MTMTKYIGMDVHKESISIAVMNAAGKLVMECVNSLPAPEEQHSKSRVLVSVLAGSRG
jgi:hypothetical protein